MSYISTDNIVGVILAGGKGRRMGARNKPLLELAGKPLIKHVIDKGQALLNTLVINANDDLECFHEYGLPIQRDIVPDYAGPLAGVLSGMVWARAYHVEATHIITIAADTPFFPNDYVKRMIAAISIDTPLACASYKGRSQPVFGLWPIKLHQALHHALMAEGIRRVDRFTSRYGVAHVAFDDYPENPFFNMNTPEDMAQAEAMAEAPVTKDCVLYKTL